TRPYLAESWQASDDLKTWTFKLRRGVKWNNGDDFGADDVVYNFKRWLDPATGSSNQGLFGAMTETVGDSTKMSEGAIEKVDDHTVRLNLNRAELAIPENLYNYPTAIVHRRFGEDGGDLSKNPVGTGPFALRDFRVGEICDLVKRNPADYWGDEVHLDGIRYIDHGEGTMQSVAALVSNQVDTVYEVSIDEVPLIEQNPNLVLGEAVTGQTGVARMQMTQAPFDDIRVRQAVVLCQDHERLLQLAHRGRGSVGEDHHVAPIHPEYAALPKRQQDHARAKALLAEAGYPNGIDLSIDVRQSPAWELNCMQAFREMLAPAGIRLNLNVMPSSQYWEVWDKTPFGFTAWTHRPLGVMVLNLGYRSGVPWNESKYSNPAFDRLLDQANATIDITERKRIMAQVQKTLQDDAIIAQPLWRSVFNASHKRVQNRVAHPTFYHQFNTTWLADA
ncbi:MAG: ABC transporter substrate-binding protein, partial [Inquilinus sp.]|nr:ABC transporter substrate-binding protein [Inquilinus sp.]